MIMKRQQIYSKNSAFTLIELLVVISIMGILLSLSIFGMQSARQASRDAKRKSDLEQIRSGLEMFRADCNKYYIGTSLPSTLIGIASYGSNCLASNIYISTTPTDPSPTTHEYVYYSDGTTYQICAALEQGGTTVSCGSVSNCGGTTCNYRVTNP
jgi:prepilin-type N-terminal cleavage/methylation domain-containing protein